MTGNSFNCNHPECKEGEVFVSNASYDDGGFHGGVSSWKQIEYKTKRAGDVAYDIYGNIIDTARFDGSWATFPVFAKQEEVNNINNRNL